jgi:tRNA pseudouridine38-40 synthase
MPVFRIDFGYDGTNFRGFARQREMRTVQGVLEQCLSRVLKEDLVTTGAGRTDAGVHARAQVASFATDADVDVERLARSLNGMLGPEIVVTSVTMVADDFSARFSAKWRAYRYQILNSELPDPFKRQFSWHMADPLDLGAMNAVASQLIGQHDFASFCRARPGATTVRRVFEASWLQEGDLKVFDIRANSFCHQMVRSVVGFSMDVGKGRRRAEDASGVLAARDRAKASLMAPPQGLILWEVGYQDARRHLEP